MQRLFPARWAALLLVAVSCTAAAASAGSARQAAPAPPQTVEGEPSSSAAGGETQPATAGQAPPPASALPELVPDASWVSPARLPDQGEPRLTGLDFWPRLDGATLTWFAIVVILMLSIRLKPLLCERNLDGLVLAATCLLLALRTDTSRLPGWAAGQTGQWWSYLLLSVAAGYWLLRGLRCLLARSVARYECPVSHSALFILVLAGLAVGIARIATGPLSAGSRDGIVGGLCMAETGKLPYGAAVNHDSRSPILYLLHAGAVSVIPPAIAATDCGAGTAVSWDCRDEWLGQEWWETADLAPARLVSGLLYILFLLALYTIGRRLHCPSIGLSMVAIFCVFPGAAECVARPEIMLPAALLGWSVALALIPGIGGLAACFLIVLAGLAWPWAWLALPVLLGYFLRQGVQAVGGIAGTLAGIAVSLVGLTWLTLPSLPRADAALYRAGFEPAYKVSRSGDAEITIAYREVGPPPETGLLRFFWEFLVDSESHLLDTDTIVPGRSRVRFADDIDFRKLLFRNLEPTDEARQELAERYRVALAGEPVVTRMWVALRTVLEQTWLAAAPPPPPLMGSWALWSAAGSADSSTWLTIRKVVKVAVGLLAVFLGLIMLFGRRPRPHQLLGALLAVSSATLLADRLGAVTHLVWLLPTLLALWAVNEPAPPAADPEEPAQPQPVADALGSGPAPRISVEK